MPQDSAQNTMVQNGAQNGVPLGTRGEIFPGVPLAGLDAIGGPAYGARLQGEGGGADLLGILCNGVLPARVDAVTAMRSAAHPSLLKLLDSGTVLWPATNTHYYGLIYSRPLAPRLKNTLDEPHAPIADDALNQHFVVPLIGALIELARIGVTHGGIRPTNMFWRAGGTSAPQLGDCLSAPPGFGQPVLFETLERAMSSPAGRGAGQPSDDSYALGVTLALMLLGQNPLAGQDDAGIIRLKNERGSFNALIGNRRLPPHFIELLRGLLADEARQRWAAADLEQWLLGRRLTPKNADTGRRASRLFAFAGQEFWQLRPLSAALAAQPTEAVQAIESQQLDKWLRRAFSNDDRALALEQAQRSLKQSGKTAHYEDQLVARACIALDPAAPIRYRGIQAMPGGVASLLVEAVMAGGGTQVLAELIASQLITFWVEMQREARPDLLPLGQQFERMKTLIDKPSFGNGVERVLYELNPGLPCLSPLLQKAYVTTPKGLLAALERAAGTAGRSREPMDRHIAAYLIVHDRRGELLFDAMTGPDTSPKRGLALLTLYSEMQHRHGPDALPNLAQWLVPLLEPALQRFLGKGLKENLRTQVKAAAAKGDLAALLRLIDDPRRIQGDQQDFMAARLLYLNTLKEINQLEAKLANRQSVIDEAGKPMAASISSFLAIMLVLAALLRAVWQAIG